MWLGFWVEFLAEAEVFGILWGRVVLEEREVLVGGRVLALVGEDILRGEFVAELLSVFE